MLVIVREGGASQIVVAMLIAVLSIAAFIHWKPYAKSENDTLAIISQISIFCTLFAALLVKVNVDDDDKYDQDVFGLLLIFVTCSGFALTVLGWMVKPTSRFIKSLAPKHVHDSPLKGLTDAHADWRSFTAYFKDVAESDVERAGWVTLSAEDWGVTRSWLVETGAVGEWRSSSGHSVKNQCRVTFDVEHDFNSVVDYIESIEETSWPTIEQTKVAENSDGTFNVYYATKMPWPLGSRDFFLQRFDQRWDDEAISLCRSVDGSVGGLSMIGRKGMVRGEIFMAGYLVKRKRGGGCRVVHVLEGDLKGIMVLDWLNRKSAGPRLKSVVDQTRMRRVVEREASKIESWVMQLRGSGGGIELGGGRMKDGDDVDDADADKGIELGDIYGQIKDSMDGGGDGASDAMWTNPIAGKGSRWFEYVDLSSGYEYYEREGGEGEAQWERPGGENVVIIKGAQ
jgi:hypothetical protein